MSLYSIRRLGALRKQIELSVRYDLYFNTFLASSSPLKEGLAVKFRAMKYPLNSLLSSYLQRASIVSKTRFIVPTDAHYYKIIEMLKQYKNYNTCSDMFRFTQEPSSGNSLVLS